MKVKSNTIEYQAKQFEKLWTKCTMETHSSRHKTEKKTEKKYGWERVENETTTITRIHTNTIDENNSNIFLAKYPEKCHTLPIALRPHSVSLIIFFVLFFFCLSQCLSLYIFLLFISFSFLNPSLSFTAPFCSRFCCCYFCFLCPFVVVFGCIFSHFHLYWVTIECYCLGRISYCRRRLPVTW